MLLRFSAEDHLSISKRQELNLSAALLRDRKDGLIPCKAVKSGAVLPAVVIYGANASGKSNFLNSIATMRQMVLSSQNRGDPAGGVPRSIFLLDPVWKERPSCFEIDFMVSEVRYHYGFEAIDDAFISEWLYEIPKTCSRKLFERKGQKFDFGS